MYLPGEIFGEFFLWFFFAVAILNLISIGHYLLIYNRSKKWIQCDGKIERKEWKDASISDERPPKLNIYYRYVYRGKEYRKNRVFLSDRVLMAFLFPASRKKMKEVARRCRSGNVNIFLDPENPSVSVLCREFDTKAFVYVVFMEAIFIAIVVSTYFFYI